MYLWPKLLQTQQIRGTGRQLCVINTVHHLAADSVSMVVVLKPQIREFLAHQAVVI